MQIYTLQAKIGEQITTVTINARDNFMAKVLTSQKISNNFVSDKRYAIGEITLKDPDGKVVWQMPEVGKEDIKKGGK